MSRWYKYGKMEGVDRKRKGGISNGVYWNYMFDNRNRNMPKSFIKIKIRSDVMIELVYRFDGEEFKEDDLIQVIRKDTFTGEKTMVTGRVIKSLLNTELVLDVSRRYYSETITLNIDEIIKVNKIK